MFDAAFCSEMLAVFLNNPDGEAAIATLFTLFEIEKKKNFRVD